MENKNILSDLLEKLMVYPINKSSEDSGMKIKQDGNDRLIIDASADDLINLADLLISLALSGENKGQHWHIDQHSMVSDDSEISEMIIMRNE